MQRILAIAFYNEVRDSIIPQLFLFARLFIEALNILMLTRCLSGLNTNDGLAVACWVNTVFGFDGWAWFVCMYWATSADKSVSPRVWFCLFTASKFLASRFAFQRESVIGVAGATSSTIVEGNVLLRNRPVNFRMFANVWLSSLTLLSVVSQCWVWTIRKLSRIIFSRRLIWLLSWCSSFEYLFRSQFLLRRFFRRLAFVGLPGSESFLGYE